MPPQTRSSTRTSRTSTARTQPPRKAQVPKSAPKPTQKPKAKPKPKVKLKAEKEVETNNGEDSEPPRKRLRGSANKPSQARKAPKAILLINLPVEVLIEIARYVHPLDLVMISRVHKSLRELFMDKRSALIWRSARENLPGLPPCPDGISEPQYASMVFTKRCSECGGYAPREMNPVLLIRLCSHCWEDILVEISRVTDRSLVVTIVGPEPGQSRSWKTWCLYSEAREVKAKLNELTKAGDEEALKQWRQERHKLVQRKQEDSEPLSRWLADRERKRARDRDNLKIVHQKEIESRLFELGWEKGDFICFDRWRRQQWRSMVCTTKTITDKVWDNLLPRLLTHLEVNRDERLERERTRRQATRRSAVYNWLDKARSLLSAYARATAIESAEHVSASTNLISSGHAARPQILRQAFPASSHAYMWPEYTPLVENDVPHEQFLIDFEEKKSEFQQSIAAWRRELEARLIDILPGDTRLPNFDDSPFTMTFEASESAQPINILSEDIQKLLRADAVFTTS